MKWARIDKGEVKEVVEVNPEGRYANEIISQFKPCNDTVEQGDIFIDGVYSKPNQEAIIVEPIINTELVDAYEAITILFEMNIDLQSRLEAVEDGL